MSVFPLPSRTSTRDHAASLRGDRISGDRYYSKEFMELEWEKIWTRVWQIGGREADIPEPGDFITSELGPESILLVRQRDHSIKAFYNVCQHRGNRLMQSEQGFVKALTCMYHKWSYDYDGTLVQVQDEEDFPQGNPCGKVHLAEIKCESWGGFVWFNMDTNAASLRSFLHPMADQLDAYQMEKLVRTVNLTVEVDCNWKIIEDNFNESYHLPSIHMELATFIDDDYKDTDFYIHPTGHNSMMMKGGQPSLRAKDPTDIADPLGDMLRYWELDPTAYKGRAREARLDLQRQKRKLGASKGYDHYDSLSDAQLTDYYHCTMFPNSTLTCSADGVQLLRPRPHPTDPAKCLFDHWFLVPNVPGMPEFETPIGSRAVEEAPHETFKHGEKSVGFVADQDLSIAVGQQLGLRSRGYRDAYLSGQESRVRRFHEVVNDYLSGRR